MVENKAPQESRVPEETTMTTGPEDIPRASPVSILKALIDQTVMEQTLPKDSNNVRREKIKTDVEFEDEPTDFVEQQPFDNTMDKNKSILKTKNGNIKKRCWLVLVVLLIIIICCTTVAIIVEFTTPKSSSSNNILASPSQPSTIVSTKHPSIQPTYERYSDIIELPLTLGLYHSCATKNKIELYCWGGNEYGQLGLGGGSQQNELLPKKVFLDTNENTIIKQVALGYYHSCALLDGGSLKCWGENDHGQIGDGTTTNNRINPTTIDVGGSIKQIAVGGFHSCALLYNGVLKCWGSNFHGQLGDGSNTDRHSPTTIEFDSGMTVRHVALGLYHSCAIMDDSSVQCWGLNLYGQIGDGTYLTRLSPTAVVDDAYASHIALGIHHSCAITFDESLIKCWGLNNHGQIGNGDTTDMHTPTTIYVGNGMSVSQVALGGYHSCAVLVDGSLYCWGRNDSGQLGNGGTTETHIPTIIIDDGSVGRSVTHIALGNFHTCAIIDGGPLKCWGSNHYGQLGDGTTINQMDMLREEYISL